MTADSGFIIVPPVGNSHTDEDGQVNISAFGILHANVWPTFIGLGYSSDDVSLDEYLGDIDYDRGQISWESTPDRGVIGHGRVYAPKGLYTHIIFAHGPIGMVCNINKMEQPLPFDRAGFVDIAPIQNQEMLPR